MQPDHRELALGEVRHRRLGVHREFDPIALRQRVGDVNREETVSVGLFRGDKPNAAGHMHVLMVSAIPNKCSKPWFEDLSLTKSTAVVAAADITPDGGKEVEDEVETSRAIVRAVEGGCKGPE